MVSSTKSTVILIFVPLDVMCPFSSGWFLDFQKLDYLVPLCGFLTFCLIRDGWDFWISGFIVSINFGKFSAIIGSDVYSDPSISSGSSITFMTGHSILSHSCCFSIFCLFSLCFSLWIFVSCSLTFSSVMSSLMLILANVFYIPNIVHFNFKILILVFLRSFHPFPIMFLFFSTFLNIWSVFKTALLTSLSASSIIISGSICIDRFFHPGYGLYFSVIFFPPKSQYSSEDTTWCTMY